jgi:hypothetical protein
MMDLNGSLNERARQEADAAYLLHGYSSDGALDRGKLAEVLLGPVAAAIATTPQERDQVCISRDGLMAIAFSKTPGPNDWAGQPNPDLAQATWEILDGDVWRVVDDGPNGAVQSRLNGGLVLVRRKGKRGRPSNVYVTHNPALLMEDVITPKGAAAARQAALSARHIAMCMERVPEAAGKFNRELVRGLNEAKNGAVAITAATLAVLEAGQASEDAGE